MFRAVVVSDIGALKSEVNTLRSELKQLRGSFSSAPNSALAAAGFCFIYLRMKSSSESSVSVHEVAGVHLEMQGSVLGAACSFAGAIFPGEDIKNSMGPSHLGEM